VALTESSRARKYWTDLKVRLQKKEDFAILTAEISKATFGMTPSQYKNHKALTKTSQNLRDHILEIDED